MAIGGTMQKLYYCGVCQRYFADNDGFKAAELKHSDQFGLRHFVCPECREECIVGKPKRGTAGLPVLYQCRICYRYFASKKMVKSFIYQWSSDHGCEAEAYACKECRDNAT